MPTIGLGNRGQEQVYMIFRLLTHGQKTESCGRREQGGDERAIRMKRAGGA